MHRRTRTSALAALALLGALLGGGGCSHPATEAPDGAVESGAATPAAGASGPLSPQEAAQVLARVGDHTITLGDYAAALDHMDSFDRLRYSAPSRRRELLDEMINVLLLADEAREKGYDQDPIAQQEVREILRDAYLAKAREAASDPSQISAADVQGYYDTHKGDFHDPERRRVSAIVTASRDSASLALDAASKATPVQWGELVRSKSIDPEAKRAGADVPLDLAGDLGFVSPPGDPRGLNARVPEEVRAAVFEIANVGEVLPRVVAASGKFYVVKLESKSDARDRSLEDVQRTIRVKLAQDTVRANEQALLDGLRKQYPVQIDEAALAQVKVDVRPDAGAP